MRQTGGGLYSRFLLNEECFCMTGNYGTGILERKSDTSTASRGAPPSLGAKLEDCDKSDCDKIDDN
jgi:hypothetical protein